MHIVIILQTLVNNECKQMQTDISSNNLVNYLLFIRFVYQKYRI